MVFYSDSMPVQTADSLTNGSKKATRKQVYSTFITSSPPLVKVALEQHHTYKVSCECSHFNILCGEDWRTVTAISHNYAHANFIAGSAQILTHILTHADKKATV